MQLLNKKENPKARQEIEHTQLYLEQISRSYKRRKSLWKPMLKKQHFDRKIVILTK
jgi:hypothetical protein